MAELCLSRFVNGPRLKPGQYHDPGYLLVMSYPTRRGSGSGKLLQMPLCVSLSLCSVQIHNLTLYQA